jgi:hypothetical protein
MTTPDREDYYDSDIKGVSKGSSVDSVKLESSDGKSDEELQFEKRTM